MRLLCWGLLWLWACFAWAIEPTDPRLKTPIGYSFVRFCSSILGHSPYQISLGDPRAETLRKFYSYLNSENLHQAMDLYAEDSVYRPGNSFFAGKAAIREELFSSAHDRFGQFRVLDVSWKNNQLFALIEFKGTVNGLAVTVEYLEVWVLNPTGQIYYRQTWSSR